MTFSRETVTDVERLRDALRERHASQRPAVDAAFMTALCLAGGNVDRLVVLSFALDGRPVGFVIGLLEPSSIATRVGRVSFGARRITRLRVPGDRAVVWDEGLLSFETAAREVAAAIGADGRTVLLLQSVVAGGHLGQLARHLNGKDRSAVLAEASQERFLTVTDRPFEKYFASLSAGTRDSFKYAQRRLSKFMDGEVRHERFERPEDVERFFVLAETISRQTYQWSELGMGMKQRDFVLGRMNLAARLGFLRGYVLFCRGEPVAFWECYASGGVCLTYQTGYLPSLGKYSVGNVLTLEMLRDLLKGDQAWCIDWMSGGSDYKRRLSTAATEEHSSYLVPKRLEWLAFSMSMAASHTLHTVGSRLKAWIKERRSQSHLLATAVAFMHLFDDATWITSFC